MAHTSTEDNGTDAGIHFTYGEAMQQFSVWQDDYGYKLNDMWITEYEDGKMVERYRVRAIWNTDTE